MAARGNPARGKPARGKPALGKPARGKAKIDAEPARPAPATATSRSQSRFDAAVGGRRGLTDARAALARLDRAERELERAQDNEHQLQLVCERLSDSVARLNESVAEQDVEIQSGCDELRACECNLLRARYALVRATAGDAPPLFSHLLHQEDWTPGRPYVCGEHAYGPEDGACYCAPPFGVPPGHPPGVSSYWVRCPVGGECPVPDLPPMDPHPVASGLALRQRAFWWDAEHNKHALHDLTDEHFEAVVAWLHEHAQRLWDDENDDARVHVPCPVQAYPDAGSWLADCPLMGALQAEALRRELSTDTSSTSATTTSELTPPNLENQ